jgi:hypothetical protein
MKFKRRHGEFEQGCVLSESYTATDALSPILPACRQPLLPACVFVTRHTVRHPRRFFFRKICSWWEAFVNRFVRDERRSWTEVPLYICVITSRSFLLRMRNVSDKRCRENQKNKFYVKFLFLSCLYELMWKNMVQPDRPQMALCHMRIACWIPKVTNTHTQNT